GISDLYPDADVRATTGSISGRVTKNGQPVFGAHVVAFNLTTGSMVAGFTLDTLGRFVIGSLAPGPYVLRTEPLDDGDTDSFLDGTIDVDFRIGYHNKVVIVPVGADSGTIDIAVTKK